MIKAKPNFHRQSKRSIAAAIIAALCFSSVALAADFTFMWDPNEEPDLAGYKIYYKTDASGPPYDGIHPFHPDLDSPVDVGNVTEYTIHDLDDDTDYYFVVTAYDSKGFESGFSNEVASAEDADLTRSTGSDQGGTGGTGCFMQSILQTGQPN